MLSPVAQTISNLVFSTPGRVASKIWHSCVPSFPVWRRLFDLYVCFDSRDHPYFWYADARSLVYGDNVADTLLKFHGLIWDAGANAGIYSLLMASKGNQVVSFDLSPKCISYLDRSIKRNGFTNIVTVARAFSVEPIRYVPPRTGIAGNKIQAAAEAGEKTAITYLEAEAKYGTPCVIKLDIEGHEEVFLKSPAFKEWVLKKKVALIVELHKPEFFELVWKETKNSTIYPGTVLMDPR